MSYPSSTITLRLMSRTSSVEQMHLLHTISSHRTFHREDKLSFGPRDLFMSTPAH